MIYFFSYGDSKYVQSKQRIRQEAISMGFDEVSVYGPENLPKEFIEKTVPHLLQPRGAGYWLWKSHFLKSTFDRMNDGDYCIYADAGCHININGKQRLEEYLEMIKEDDCGVMSFEITGLTESMYTNEKVFEHFGMFWEGKAYDIDSNLEDIILWNHDIQGILKSCKLLKNKESKLIITLPVGPYMNYQESGYPGKRGFREVFWKKSIFRAVCQSGA
jgi:hypothetical protein